MAFRTKGLNPADDLFHTCIYAAPWNKIPPIRWVADAVAIIGTGDDLDWDRLIEQSRKRYLNLTLENALVYLRREFDVPVPPTTIDTLDRVPVSELEYHANQKLGK